MSDGYLSRDRAHLAALQRKRRARMARIDYMPGPEALAAIEAKRATLPEWGGLSTNSATIDAIVTEWAELTGINSGEVEPPKSPEQLPELPDKYARARMSPDAERSARAQESGQFPALQKGNRCGTGQESGEPSGINEHIASARAGAYESGQLTALQMDGRRELAEMAGSPKKDGGAPMPTWAAEWMAQEARRQATRRVTCGAKRHRDGQPCQAKSEPGKRRCRFHGGRSTGPRTPEGKARALVNLRQYRPNA